MSYRPIDQLNCLLFHFSLILFCLYKLEIVDYKNYVSHLEYFVLNPYDICLFPTLAWKSMKEGRHLLKSFKLCSIYLCQESLGYT